MYWRVSIEGVFGKVCVNGCYVVTWSPQSSTYVIDDGDHIARLHFGQVLGGAICHENVGVHGPSVDAKGSGCLNYGTRGEKG